MATPARRLRHPWRWTVAVVVAVFIALALALVVYVYRLLQPQRFTSLLERNLAAYGVTLTLDAPARPALFPHPAVQLEGFSVANAGAQTPILKARGATIVVPWRALLHGEAAVERIDVDTPRIDLAQLRSLLAKLPQRRGPPRLPSIDAGVHMSNGSVTDGGAPVLFDLDLDTGELVPGRPFRMRASARRANGRVLAASIETVPAQPRDGAIALDPLRIAFDQQGGPSLQLAGRGQWRGGEALALQLDGTLKHRALAPPAAASAARGSSTASGTAAAATVVDQLALRVQPAKPATPLSVAVKLDGDDSHADFHLQPTEFGRWWQRVLAASPQQPAGPLPFAGTAHVQKLDIGWLQATGLSVEADRDLAPAAASSGGSAPAPSTAH